MSDNLGNVVGLIKSQTAPTKTYVIWAYQYDSGDLDKVRLKYYNHSSLAWEDLQPGALGAFKIYSTISARDADAATYTQNEICFVTDASSDSTVTSGAALYVWNDTSSTFTKISEFESLDVALNWTSITGKPNSWTKNLYHHNANQDLASIATNVLQFDTLVSEDGAFFEQLSPTVFRAKIDRHAAFILNINVTHAIAAPSTSDCILFYVEVDTGGGFNAIPESARMVIGLGNQSFSWNIEATLGYDYRIVAHRSGASASQQTQAIPSGTAPAVPSAALMII